MSNSYKDKTWEEIFAKEISEIKKTEVKIILKEVFAKVQDKHKTAPASSTGKYHPAIALGDGGLIRHTKLVALNAAELVRAVPELESERDEIVAAAILHDLCKYPNGEESQYTSANHPTLMAKLIVETCPSSETAKTLARLVECHQGRAEWNTDRKTGELINRPPEKFDEWVLHFADLYASRPFLAVRFDDNGDIILDRFDI